MPLDQHTLLDIRYNCAKLTWSAGISMHIVKWIVHVLSIQKYL